MRLLVATVWAYPGRPLNESPLWQSCRRQGIPLFVSQHGRPFRSYYRNKLVQLAEDLNQLTWDIVLYVDADDAFLTRYPHDVADVLESYGAGFVVGGEAECWPAPERHRCRYPANGPVDQFPNAGVWLAERSTWETETRALIELAESGAMDHPETINDQFWIQERILSGRSSIAVDDRGLLCLNQTARRVPGRIMRQRVLLGDGPPVVHGPGATKGQAVQLWRDFCRVADLRAEVRYEHSAAYIPADVPLGPALAHNQVAGLLEFIRTLPPLGTVAEVGCWRGVSTEVWALFAERVYAIDLFDDASSCRAFMGRMARYPHVQAIRGESTRAAKVFPDGSLDMVYIDADHNYEAIKADLRAWLPKVRLGGWIAGHDHMEYWDCGGVIRAVNELLGGADRVFPDYSWVCRLPTDHPSLRRASAPIRPEAPPGRG